MKIIVGQHKLEIVKEPVNEREIDISKCEFEFDEAITSEYVKEAYFTLDGATYKQIILNDECDIPSEVLVKKGTVEIGVVAFLVEDEEEIKRYNPSPAYFNTWVGSLKDDAENSEPVTPTDKEQMEQALQEGLNSIDNKLGEVDDKMLVVDGKIEDIDTAITQTNNLNIDVNKVDKTTQVDLTKKDGTTKTVYINDGTSLQFMWQGTSLGIKTDDMEQYVFVNLQGIQGQPGPQGEPFRIKKTYTSVAEMNTDFDNMNVGDYAMIASTVEIEDNAKLYVKGDSQWIFITDFSGAQGIKGETGATPIIRIGTVTSGSTPSVTISGTAEEPVFNFVLQPGEQGRTGETGAKGDTGNGIASIVKTASAGLIDTYTITFTDGTTSTFEITNGADGGVTQEYVDEHDDQLRTLFNVLPKVSDSGESVTLENTGDTMLYKMDLKGNTSQEVIQGEVGLEEEDTSIYVDDVNEDKENYITLKGNTSQETTTGRNLFNVTDYTNLPLSSNGSPTNSVRDKDKITFTSNVNSGFSGVYIAKDNYSNIIDNYDETKSYYVTADIKTNINCDFRFVNQSSVSQITVGTQRLSFYGILPTIVFYVKNNNANIEISNIMIAETSETDYEPYTNGASPNPDYPQEVEVVTGENVVKVEGKNLFDKDNANVLNAYINNTNSTITNDNNMRTLYISCKSNTTYTISKILSSRFIVISSVNTPDNNVVGTNIVFNNSATSLTITTGASDKYIAVFYYNSSADTLTEEETRNSIQIEQGSTATTYEAYKSQTYPINLGRYFPAGYTQVDYIESTGTQYIDTGYIPDYINGYKIECEVCPTELSNRYCILSGYNVTNSISLEITQQNTARAYFLYDSNRALNKILGTITSNKNTLIIEYLNGRFTHTLNGETSSETINLLGTANESMYMFVDRQLRYSTFYKPLKMYKCKLYNNNYLIRNFVPCYRNSDNEVGMYDLVNGVFYTNQGTGAFTYGNVVPNTSIELCKIGTYQDRIYKSNGNWYLHKEIGKYVCNSTRTNAVNDYMSGVNEISKNGTYSLFLNDTSSDISNNTMYFSVAKYEYNSIITGNIDAQNNLSDNSFCMRQGTNDRIYFKNSAFTGKTGEEISPLLNGKTLFYVLITPTETQITDTTLVNQLNALYNATIYSTTHINTETSNLLPYIDLKYNVVTASPSPERASEVEVVKGNNTITISNEDGTKTQTYNITLGNLELCKIGNYQDYFYKDNGNWYKYGAIGKVVLDGSNDEELSITTTANGNEFRYFDYSIKVNSSSSNIMPVFSSHFVQSSPSALWNSLFDGIAIADTSKRILFKLADSSINTLELFKKWLSYHNTTVYYILDTAISIEITDELLISQLNELKKAMSYYDKTLITQTNASKPFILDVVGIRDLQDIFNL